MNATKKPPGPEFPEAIVQRFFAARAAQCAWGAVPVRKRLRVIARTRELLAARAARFAHAASHGGARSFSEALAGQVLPLADACRFLEKQAAAVLAPRRLGARGRPLWLAGLDSEIRREPFGVVLVIAPANYPLLLPGVQVLQALVAGNAVFLKPAPGGGAAARELAAALAEAGLDRSLLVVLDESAQAACEALALPVDKVVFTGSFATGGKVLAALSRRAIPCVAELSGCDAVFVREDANLELCVEALLFGLAFNESATCIAPRRVFVARQIARRFEERLRAALHAAAAPVAGGAENGGAQTEAAALLSEALEEGATVLIGGFDSQGGLRLPCVLSNVDPRMRIAQADHFLPILCVIHVEHDAEALRLDAACPYALGATIFSRNTAAAQRLAAEVCAGIVLINDMIVPTADPRIGFGGRQRSGFGVTRGAEGLLEMTQIKVIQRRAGRMRPHLAAVQPGDERLFLLWMEAAHGRGFFKRTGAALRLAARLIQRAWD